MMPSLHVISFMLVVRKSILCLWLIFDVSNPTSIKKLNVGAKLNSEVVTSLKFIKLGKKMNIKK